MSGQRSRTTSTGDLPQSLLLAFNRLDNAFSRSSAHETASLFSEGGRLMWPSMEDIVGREAIESALAEFFDGFTLIAPFSPERQVVEVGGNRVFALGRFTEDLQPNSDAPAYRVHGRIVEIWSRTNGDAWQLDVLLTSRYAENEALTG